MVCLRVSDSPIRHLTFVEVAIIDSLTLREGQNAFAMTDVHWVDLAFESRAVAVSDGLDWKAFVLLAPNQRLFFIPSRSTCRELVARFFPLKHGGLLGV